MLLLKMSNIFIQIVQWEFMRSVLFLMIIVTYASTINDYLERFFVYVMIHLNGGLKQGTRNHFYAGFTLQCPALLLRPALSAHTNPEHWPSVTSLKKNQFLYHSFFCKVHILLLSLSLFFYTGMAETEKINANRFRLLSIASQAIFGILPLKWSWCGVMLQNRERWSHMEDVYAFKGIVHQIIKM